jgi:hypothetical protein
MMWDEVLPLWVDLLEADAALVAELGTDKNGQTPIYQAQSSRAVHTPSVEYSTPYSDLEEENFNPFSIQVDVFARQKAPRSAQGVAAAIERHIREITHRDTARELGGYRLWMQYIDSGEIPYPADSAVIHRRIDFRFTPLRDKYADAY